MSASTSHADYTCIDCDSGDLTYEQARYHAHHNNHCVVRLDEEEENDG